MTLQWSHCRVIAGSLQGHCRVIAGFNFEVVTTSSTYRKSLKNIGFSGFLMIRHGAEQSRAGQSKQNNANHGSGKTEQRKAGRACGTAAGQCMTQHRAMQVTMSSAERSRAGQGRKAEQARARHGTSERNGEHGKALQSNGETTIDARSHSITYLQMPQYRGQSSHNKTGLPFPLTHRRIYWNN